MAEGTRIVKCPVCGMEIEVGSEVAKLYGAVRAAPRATSTYEGTEYFFCCKACKKKFDENPTHYTKK
ncbi:MAG: YHS domain-containing protein [Deltaproteobacteria bacterium]|nr:YHS domain-containing protein [Deltaproteobacteria bacterium]